MSRWWRAYDEAVDDPKLILLSDKAHRAWFNLMCIASLHDGILPDIKITAVKLRLTPQRAAAVLTELVHAGLIDRRDDGAFEPHNWSGRQYRSDVTDPTAAERMQRYRERKRNGGRNDRNDIVTVTPPREQNTETDTDSSLRSEGARAKRGARLPDDWMPSQTDLNEAVCKISDARVSEELLKFKDYWKAQPGQRGVKLDWDATWRNWIRNANRARGSPPRPLTQHQVERQESREILNDLKKFIDGNGGSGDANPGLLRLDPSDGQESFHGGFRRNVVDIPLAGTRKSD